MSDLRQPLAGVGALWSRDAADAGQILVAGVVRELSMGKGHDFSDSGPVELQGFDAPIQLFEVAWA